MTSGKYSIILLNSRGKLLKLLYLYFFTYSLLFNSSFRNIF
nr:MAG TPA: hypothetical protein [Caudoviricetes sp.]